MKENKLGERIAKLRKAKGLTQQELGDIVGVGARAVSKWECNITMPDITIISDVAKALDVDIAYLMDPTTKIKHYQEDYKSTTSNKIKKQKEISNLSTIVCKSVTLAMSIGVIVLNILNKIEVTDSITLLAIGLLTISIAQFNNNYNI